MSLLNLQNLKTKKEPKYIKKIIQSIDDKPLSNEIIDSIKEIKPNILVKGGDYKNKNVVGEDIVDKLQIVKFHKNQNSILW